MVVCTISSRGESHPFPHLRVCKLMVHRSPGWQNFLSHVATKYEMHVYTMGTRAYAEEVCAAIDPDGKLFGGRILSRDESGSESAKPFTIDILVRRLFLGLTQKSLQRLFPCDQSMVVIIDDRADVWEWSPNLVKVIPCWYLLSLIAVLYTDNFIVDDFFVGIGDINSAFLPKLEPIAPVLPQEVPQLLKPEPTTTETAEDNDGDLSTQLTDATDTDTTLSLPGSSLSLDGALSFEDSERSEMEKKEILTRNHMALDQQVEERPLAKKQEELQVASSASASPSSNGNATPGKGDVNSVAPPKPAVRKALLKNDDIELTRVQNVCCPCFLLFVPAR